MFFGKMFYGVHKATIGIDEFLISCPACETDNYADFMVTSNYYNFYFIPVFPFEKEANIICQKCGLKRYSVPFESNVIKEIVDIKGKFKHPLYTYVCLLFVLIITLIIVLNAIY